MARLNSKDSELTLTGKSINLSDSKNAYIGGEFLTNPRDYIEVLIYDTNNNFLESAIVNEEDYLYDQDTGIKLKTGTILRKMGYDRGKFVVKYNFLRQVAGSYENVALDENNNITEYVEGETRLKEYKYFIHEISPSRQEVRLAVQNINDEQYLRDFYYAQRTKKIVQSDGTAGIIFEGEAHGQPVQEESLAMRFPTSHNTFLPEMVGGTIVFPDVFIKSFTEVPQPYTGEGIIPEDEIEGAIRARFYIDREASYTEIENANGNLGDKMFALAIERFANNGVGFNDETLPASLTGIDFQGTSKMSNIRNLKDSNFNCMYYEYGGGTDSRVVVRSNSTLPNVDTPTNYLWEITGWDKDNTNPVSWNPITPRTGASGGDFTIESSSDPTVATTAGLSNSFQAKTDDGTDGSTFIFTMHSKNLHIGIKLTVSQPFGDGSAESTIWLPAIIENQPD